MSHSTPVLRLPNDIWIHCIAPFFRLHAPAWNFEDGTRLLHLFRMTPEQRKQTIARMRHPVYEFRARVDMIVGMAYFPSFAKTLLAHAIRPCLRFMEEPRPPAPRPLVIDTGLDRRIGRDHLLMSLLAAVLRFAIKPVNVIVICATLRSCAQHNEVLTAMVHKADICRYNQRRLELRGGRVVRFFSFWSMNTRGVSADLILCNDFQAIQPHFVCDILAPLLVTGASMVALGQGELMDHVVRSLKLREPDSPCDFAHALLAPRLPMQ